MSKGKAIIVSEAVSELGGTAFKVDDEGAVTYLDGNAAEPSQSDIDAKVALEEVLEARRNAYASIEDQLDQQYHDLVDDTTTWKDAVAKVKSDNPKP
tara:strand:- start:33 stop:323 length:291 start_codon:yes stop_codon:yes gene_type:complete